MRDRASSSRQRNQRVLAAFAVALLLGCGDGASDSSGTGTAQKPQAQEGQPVRGDWLVQHLLSDPENLNPLTSNDLASSRVVGWVLPPLLTLDNQTLGQRPVIAIDLPEISDDKLTYTFRLRHDVTFSDNTPLTAEDLLFTVKVIKNPEVLAPQTRNYFESVRDVVAVDPFTVRFDLRRPYFLNTLVLGSIQTLPRHYYDPEGLLNDLSIAELEGLDKLKGAKKDAARRFAERFNKEFNRRILGPGAFMLADPNSDIVTGERIVLTRRKDFWAPDDPTHGDAHVNKVVFRIINDLEAALVALKRGDLDLLGLTPSQHKRQTSTPQFEEHTEKKVYISPGYTYIGWNQERSIFEARVRRALRYFIDKRGMIDTILLGLGVPVEGPIFVERPEYDRTLPEHVFDPEKGKVLLAEAGWIDSDGDGWLDKVIDGKKRKLSFEILSNSGNDIRKQIGLVVIDEMKRAGIEATFRQIDWTILLERVRSQDYDAVVLGWAMSVTEPDPYQVWHSSQAVAGGSNHVSFKNAEVDKILEEYRVEFDPAKRKQLIDRFQQIIYEEQPYAFLFMQQAISAWDRRFHGVSWYPSGSTDLNEWWVPLELQKYN